MKKQGGFTLIELVVVIVILGILAVTAAPKFLNLQDDAKVSAVKGLAGAMKGAAGITYGKAAVRGVESLDAGASGASITIGDDTVNLKFGYPTVDSLPLVVDGLDTDDWAVTTSSATSISYGYTGFDCVATYDVTDTDVNTPAKITVEGQAEGCEATSGSN
ncbi:MAG: type II secretion system protein [Vibrio litoralis]|uniref:type II secretion system protein n=1 Tax=Vibrio litoralis TaxID=335972 RepID=UPI003F9B7C2C